MYVIIYVRISKDEAAFGVCIVFWVYLCGRFVDRFYFSVRYDLIRSLEPIGDHIAFPYAAYCR